MAVSFRSELIKKSPEPIDLYEVSLDTARTQTRRTKHRLSIYSRSLSRWSVRIDLIVPIGAPAAFFVQRHRPQLFPATPMLIVGADKRRISSAMLTENDAAVLLDLDLPAYLKNILRLRSLTPQTSPWLSAILP